MYNHRPARFTQPDSLTPGGLQGPNCLSCVMNNPVNFNDLSGHLATCNPVDPGPQCHTPGDGGCGQIDPKTLATDEKKSTGAPTVPLKPKLKISVSPTSDCSNTNVYAIYGQCLGNLTHRVQK
jgi:hypothetical protein